MSDFFILYLILFTSAQALAMEIFDILYIHPKGDNISTYKLYRTLIFYTAITLGFFYISKLFIILLILDLIHSNARDEFDNSGWYRYLDYTLCCLGFLYQMYWVYQTLQ